MKKFIKVVLSIMLVSTIVLTGCVEKGLSVEETAKAYYDAYIKDDGSGIIKVGYSDDEVKDVMKKANAESAKIAKDDFQKMGLKITDEMAVKVVEARVEGLKKITPTIEVISNEKDTAVVKVSANHMNTSSMGEKALKETQKELNGTGASDDKVEETYVQKYIENLKNPELSKDKGEITYEFKKGTYDVKGKARSMWLPKDSEEFQVKLEELLIK